MNSFFIYPNYVKTRPLNFFDEIVFHLPQLCLRPHKVTNSTTHLKKLVLTAAFMGLCASFSRKRRPRQQFLSLKPATRTICTPSKDHSGNEHIATVFSRMPLLHPLNGIRGVNRGGAVAFRANNNQHRHFAGFAVCHFPLSVCCTSTAGRPQPF